MVWTITYEESEDRLWIRGVDRKRVNASDDLSQMVRHARRLDKEATFELSQEAERFRSRIFGEG